MDKFRKSLNIFFTYVMTFALVFYIGGPEIPMAITFALILGIFFFIFTIVEDLREARDPVFTLFSIVCVFAAVAKLTAPFICGWISGSFAMLAYIYLMRQFVWLESNKKDTNTTEK